MQPNQLVKGVGAGILLLTLSLPKADAGEAVSLAATAAGRPGILERSLYRFEFDNDIVAGSDDGFSAGWSLQLHSPLFDTWDEHVPSWLQQLPGLEDDGERGRIVRWVMGFGQAIVTPEDVTIAEPQPEDTPWAGIAGVFGGLSSYDNRRLSAVQLFLGCMGPCSQADEVQRFTHEDLGWGEPPAGWSNQLENQPLGNLNLAWAHKLWAPEDDAYLSGRWAWDVATGAQIGLGNLATYLRAQLELRCGFGLPMGFTHVPDPLAFGLALDPVYVVPEAAPQVGQRWRGYASVVLRGTHYEHMAPAEGGRTANGGHHPGMNPNVGQPELLVGLHVGRSPVAFHLTYYCYLSRRNLPELASHPDWMNFSFEFRF